MPDIADDRAAYRDAMARAEAASGIERDAEGTELNGIESIVRGETPVVTPELEGAVPVAASDQPLTPEPDAETTDTSEQQPEAPAEPVAPAAEPTVEELKAQLAASEARIEEQKQMIGRQSTEVSETRAAIDDLKAQIAAVQATQQTPQTPVTQELIFENPALAVQLAYEQKNETAFKAAMEAWKDDDPFTASVWVNDRKLEQQQAAFEARLAEQDKQLTTVSESSADEAENRLWAEAFTEVKATRPDFLENAERLLSEVAPLYPSFLTALQGDARQKADALAALYALDKMGNPEATKKALEDAATEAEKEAAAARTAATVTSQVEAGQPAEKKTDEQLEQEAYLTRSQAKPSLAKGWTGRG